MTVFSVGDTVEVLDDTLAGVVVAISDNILTVETEAGFTLDYAPEELIKVDKNSSFGVTNHEVAQIKKQKEIPKRKKFGTVKPKQRNLPKMEVDLHIHQLTKSSRGMSNYDILDLQLETAKRQLDFAIQKRIQKVVFIHGVGEGVLKEELYYLFKKYDNLKFYDADYQKYGLGATEVYIFQNTTGK